MKPNLRIVLSLLAVFVFSFATAWTAPAEAQLCAQVITFAENPDTGECVAFPTPCDVPEGWEDCGPGPISLASTAELQPLPDAAPQAEARGGIVFCPDVITFAEDPETGECIAFPTPCDVPEGWELCNQFPIF